MPQAPTVPAIRAAQDQYARALDAREAAATDRLQRYWSRVLASSQADLDDVLAKVAAARRDGTRVSPAWLYQETRARTLIEQAAQQVQQFSRTAHDTITTVQQESIQDGAQAAMASTEAALRGDFMPNPPAHLAVQAGYLADGSPVADLLATFAPMTSRALEAALVQGIAQGWSVAQMRQVAMSALGISRNRADTIVRTEMMRTYREVHRATFEANSDLLAGWTWWATLGSGRTCGGCIAMHGTIHPNSEALDGHPRCRCAMVPITDGTPRPQTGVDWLAAQPESVQRHYMGAVKFQAYKRGEIRLTDLVARTSDPRWGTMRRERSLVEIRQGRNANVNGAVTVPKRPRRAAPRPAPEPVAPVAPAAPDFSSMSLSDLMDRKMNGVPADQADALSAAIKAAIRREMDAEAEAGRRAIADSEAWTVGLPRKPEVHDSHEPDLKATNPRYQDSRAYQVNCTHCVSTMEMRRRGFDVTALPLPAELVGAQGRKASDLLDRWVRPDGSRPEWEVNTRTGFKRWAAEQPEGARGWVVIQWARTGGGHVYNWEVKGGRVIYYDGQVALDDASGHLARARTHVMGVRVDDLLPTAGLSDFITPVARG